MPMQSVTRTYTDQQSTNAALAALAAAGNAFALGQLWEINRGLLRSLFWKWYPNHREQADAHGLTADDFEQEGFLRCSMLPKRMTRPKALPLPPGLPLRCSVKSAGP